MPTISRKTLVPIPNVFIEKYMYNGESQGPIIKGLEIPRINIQNETAIDAGNYLLTISLKDTDTTTWEDGSIEDRKYEYSIEKLTQTISTTSSNIELTIDDPTLSITITGAQGSISAIADNNSVVETSVDGSVVTLNSLGKKGSTSVKITAESTDLYYKSNEIEVTVNVVPYVLGGFGELTDKQLVALVNAADRGEVDLYEDAGWRVGDERTIHLNHMKTRITSFDYEYIEQDITLVLMHRGGYTLSTPVESGRKACSFVVGAKDILLGKSGSLDGLMSWTDNSEGGWGTKELCQFLNGAFYETIPQTIRPIFKSVKVACAQAYNGTGVDMVDNYFFLPGTREIYGGTDQTARSAATQYANPYEFNALFQFDYYKDESNRIKNGMKQASPLIIGPKNYWTRSMDGAAKNKWCMVKANGTYYNQSLRTQCGVSPVGCI